MTARITLEEATKRINERCNNTIEILSFTGIKKEIKLKCLVCGNIWDDFAYRFVNGERECKICNPKKRKAATKFSLENAIKYLEKRNCSFFKDYPKDINNIVGIIFNSCGHVVYRSFHNFKRNHSCNECRINNFYVNRFPESKILEIMVVNNFKFISFPNGYRDGGSIIEYECSEGHTTARMAKTFVKFPTCKQCKIIERGKNQRGENGHGWKGGISPIWVAARARLDPWTTASLREANYQCCITGQTNVPLDVHHIVSFETIAKEAIREFGITDENYYWNLYSYYGEEVVTRIAELNMEYGLGAVIRKDIHILYHKLYLHGKNTREQFEEFKERIASGELILPD
jgi:hypothetical protein